MPPRASNGWTDAQRRSRFSSKHQRERPQPRPLKHAATAQTRVPAPERAAAAATAQTRVPAPEGAAAAATAQTRVPAPEGAAAAATAQTRVPAPKGAAAAATAQTRRDRSNTRPSTKESRRSGDRSKMLPHAPRPPRVVEHRVASRGRARPLRFVRAERSLLAPRPIGAVHAESRGEPEREESEEGLDHRSHAPVSAGSSCLGGDQAARGRRARQGDGSRAFPRRRSSG
jgi:hypothetical protein